MFSSDRWTEKVRWKNNVVNMDRITLLNYLGPLGITLQLVKKIIDVFNLPFKETFLT